MQAERGGATGDRDGRRACANRRTVGRNRQTLEERQGAAEQLHEVTKAVHPSDESSAKQLAEELVEQLWNGELEKLLNRLRELSAQAGAPRQEDAPGHPRKVLASNVGYFEKHQGHMKYP